MDVEPDMKPHIVPDIEDLEPHNGPDIEDSEPREIASLAEPALLFWRSQMPHTWAP